jgi:hypothetical protein
MIDHLKYVIIEDYQGVIQPIIFTPFLDHNRLTPGFKIHAAGFVSLHPKADKIEAQVWGKSTTLEIHSRPEDAQIIEQAINPNY